jgi:MFS family permease
MAAGMDAERALRYATGAQGGLLSIFALVAIVLMLSPVAQWVDRRGVLGLSIAGLAILAVSTAVLAVGGTLEADALAMVLYGAGFGILFPAAAAMVGISTARPERGRAYGVFNLSFDAGLAAGPLLAGALAVSMIGLEPFVTATILIAVVALVVRLVGRSGEPA